MNIAEWLRALGLERYQATFRENDVTAELLPNLTAGDLKDLGISSVGHRRQLMEAIGALRRKDAPTDEPVQLSATPSANIGSPETAERRPLSVMFCDLVGSTALSSRLDPEDLRQVIRAYQACVATTIQQFDGFIARYVGDGVLIYFGWPEARETDAERAVRAALAVAAAVGTAPLGGEPLQVRIGIATGLVVIGEPIGAGDSRQQTAVGETPNLAARLQGLAGPSQVVIDAATRRQIGGLFEVHDLGTVELKGLTVAVPAWHVLSENRALGQFEALRSGATPLVGRDEEIELLLRRWEQAKAGNGRVVLISAEPGVGKSRLTEALAERIGTEPHARVRHFCSPHHQDSALYPVIAQMERTAGFVRTDEPPARLAKLQVLLAAAAPPPEDVALIAELHSLPLGDLVPPHDLTPRRKKEKTYDALLRQVEGLAKRRPVLMVFDDLHWIDPSSRELLDRIIERVAEWPVLLLATFRPEFQPPWTGQPHVLALTLARLDRRNTATMVSNVAGDTALPPEIVAEIAQRTDGVPLFVEELTKAVLESDGQTPAALSSVPHAALSVPATLHASLMARLDRLGLTAKEVAQTGAAIGREFGHDLLASTTDLPEPQLREALDRLTNAGLLFARGTPPQSNYIFKHALVRDAAYGTLLRDRRQRLHARIAGAFEDRFPEIVLAQPALLAHHCAEAGLAEKAIAYLHLAARQAIARSAMAEAVAQLHQGLGILAGLPDGAARRQQELDLQMALGVPLSAIRGMAAPEVGRAYARARELCLQVGDTPQLTSVLFGLWLFHEVRADLQAAHEVAEQLLDMAQRGADSADLMQAHRAMGHTLLWRGEFAPALVHFERATALYDSRRHRSLTLTYGHEPGVLSRGFAAHVLWYLGYPNRAQEAMSAALFQGRKVAHPFSLAFALDHAAWLHQYLRQPAKTQERAEEDMSFSGEQGFPFFLAQGTILRGWALAEKGQVGEGIAQICQGLAAHEATGALLSRPYWVSLLAQAYGRGRRAEDALRMLDEALAMTHDQHVWKAELYRHRGEFLLLRLGGGDNTDAAPAAALGLTEVGRFVDQVESCFRHAIDIARGQQAKILELRAGTSLARLWRDQGKRDEARDLLGPIYNWFTEGFDAPDLKDAKALLDELA
jgi:class 3 adenylate cyclase/predicted ATPase